MTFFFQFREHFLCPKEVLVSFFIFNLYNAFIIEADRFISGLYFISAFIVLISVCYFCSGLDIKSLFWHVQVQLTFSKTFVNHGYSDGLPWWLGFAWQRSYHFFIWGCRRFGGKHSPSSSYWRGKGMLIRIRSHCSLFFKRKPSASLHISYSCRQILIPWRWPSAQLLMWCRRWHRPFALCFHGWDSHFVDT